MHREERIEMANENRNYWPGFVGGCAAFAFEACGFLLCRDFAGATFAAVPFGPGALLLIIKVGQPAP